MLLGLLLGATPEFAAGEPGWTSMKSGDVAAVAADALRYLREAPDDPALAPGIQGGTRAEVEATLTTVVALGHRIGDPAVLRACFAARLWGPALRLTRYVVWEVEGAAERDATHPFALYAVPDDEAGLTAAEAEGRDLLRFRYTRAQVRDGVYLPGGAAAGRARPLVWLSLADHEQALMQGTVSVRVGGVERLYNVDRPNGILWNPKLAGSPDQPRTWYFRETDAVRGWGVEPAAKIMLQPFAAVAGDVDAIGAGTVLALSTKDGWRIVVLADTGGAFRPNLNQLDLYSGSFPSRAAYQAATAAIGDTAEVWVLSARPGCPI